MSQHVADRILAALEAQLATVAAIGPGRVFFRPLASINEADMPCVIVDEIEDDVVAEAGYFPVEEQHALRFTVFVCQMVGAAGFRGAIATLHHDVELALVGSAAARSLGGLLTTGLKRPQAVYAVDAESLQKPVGGWRLSFTCTYFLRSDQPGNTEKEKS